MDGAGTYSLQIDWRSHVYLQQVWRNAEPEYLVFNQTGGDIDVLTETTCLIISDTGERLPPCYAVRLAGPWHVPADSYSSFPASDLASRTEWLTFRLATGRKYLGMLWPPLALSRAHYR